MDITRDVMRLTAKGMTPNAIRGAIETTYGTRDATPTPWPPLR